MKLTNNDIDLLTLVTRHGWITADVLVLAGFYQHQKSGLRRLRKLTDEGYLEKSRPFYSRPQAYWTTYQGQQLSESYLEPPNGPDLNEWTHDITVTRLSFYLLEHDDTWDTERELYSEQCDFDHVPDGAIHRAGSRVAVEYENSRKGKGRLEELLRDYVRQQTFDEVLYLARDDRLHEHILECGADTFDKINVATQEPITAEMVQWTHS